MNRANKRAKRILLVEDEADIALIIKLKLEDRGDKLFHVSDPSEIYQVLPRRMFSAAIVDLHMPKLNGLQVLEYIKKKVPSLPVIITSAHGNEDIVVETFLKGAADYLVKPFSTEDLLKKVDRAIYLSEVQKQNTKLKREIDIEFKKVQSELNQLKKEKELLEKNQIVKCIEFEEDVYQAGVGILHYFSTVLHHKYPNTNVKVRIEQEGSLVRMIVETPNGQKDKIERTLEEYGLVVTGEMRPEEFLADPFQVLRLKQKLELTALELSQTKELLSISKLSQKQSQEEVSFLRRQISAALKRESNTGLFISKLIQDYDLKEDVKALLSELGDRIAKGIGERDREIIVHLLEKIRRENSSAFDDLKSYLISSLGGATGNILSSWLSALYATLPRA